MSADQSWLTNLAPIFGIVFLYLVNFRSRTLSRRSRLLFYGLLFAELAGLLPAKMGLSLATLPAYAPLRGFCSAIRYASRPCDAGYGRL